MDFVIQKVKNIVPQTYIISDLKGEEIIGMFYEKELKNINHTEFRVEKVTERKTDKLHFKWKCYGNLFNNWVDKKDIIV